MWEFVYVTETWGEFAICGLRHLLPESITYYSRSSRGELELRAIITPRTHSNPMCSIKKKKKKVQHLDSNGYVRISVALEVQRLKTWEIHMLAYNASKVPYLKNVTKNWTKSMKLLCWEKAIWEEEKWVLNREKYIHFHAFVYMRFLFCLNRTWEQMFHFWLYQYCPLLLYISLALSLSPHTWSTKKSILYGFRLSILIQICNLIILARLCYYVGPPITAREWGVTKSNGFPH